MSPIGRLFVVLNLILAAIFVGFAGTYLQSADDWKTKHDDVVTEKNELETRLEGQLAAVSQDLVAMERRHNQADQARANLETDNARLVAENERLQSTLTAIQGDVASLQASAATVASSIDRATTDAAQARQASIAASAERDEAVRARLTAEADLRDANVQIAQLTDTIGERDTRIAALDANIREQGVLLQVAIANGFVPAMAQPSLEGTVNHVAAGGKLVTITVTDNPSAAEIKPGYSFAIYRGEDYKGEAHVTSVDGNFAFCRVEGNGRPIMIGDSAKTNTY
jgi:uncharacterized protein (DUF2126 family)